MTPADVVIKAFGGVRPLARAMGMTPPAITYWRQKGTVPAHRQGQVLALAVKLGLRLTPNDLVRGR